MSALDPRAPFVIDVQELGRRPGAMMTRTRSVPAPAGLANSMIGIPEGSDLDLDITAEAVVDGVLVTGTVGGDAQGVCSRCLEPMSESVSFRLLELYRHPDDVEEDDDDSPTFTDELIDLQPAIRDAAVLELPTVPLCSQDCVGLCPECGIPLAGKPDHQHERLDDRWAALQGFMTDEAVGSDRSDEEAG